MKKLICTLLSLAALATAVFAIDEAEEITQNTSEIPAETEITETTAEEMDTVYSGECGYGLTWKYDTSTNVLTISGKGYMNSYDITNLPPWYDYRDQISKVVIKKGVSDIGNMAFVNCSMTSVTIPEGVDEIGQGAFGGCSSLKSVTLPESLRYIRSVAFSGCTSLTSITIPEKVKLLGFAAFNGCSNLKYAKFNGGAPEAGDCIFDGCASEFVVKYPLWEGSNGWDPWSDTWNDYPAQSYGNAIKLKGMSVDVNFGFYLKVYYKMYELGAGTEIEIKGPEGRTLRKKVVSEPEYDYYLSAFYVEFLVNAKELTQPITVTLYDYDGTVIETYTTTVKDYLMSIKDSEYDGELAMALMKYGAAAQKYFNYHTDNLADADISFALMTPNWNSEPTQTGSVDGVQYEGTALLLKEGVYLRHYFTISGKISDYTFDVPYYDEEVKAVKKSGSLYYIDMPQTNSYEMALTLKIKKSSQTYELECCVADICEIIYENRTSYSSAMVNLAKAIYTLAELMPQG